MRTLILTLLCAASALFAGEAEFRNKEVEINISDTPISAFIQMIGAQSELEVSIGPGVSGSVTESFGKTTPYSALFKVARKNGLKFTLNKGTLFVSKKESDELAANPKEALPVEPKGNGIEFIKLKYLEAKTIPERVKSFMLDSEKLLVDETSNSVTLLGSRRSANAIRNYLEYIDTPPTQIMIEAQIIEMTKNKYREFGVSLGDLDNTDLKIPDGAKGTGSIKTSRGLAPNLSMGIKIGSIAGNLLQSRIDAAEQSGEAKVISRPKVATLNNIAATIVSGITFNVKTATTSETGQAVVGTIKEIKAGLSLNVTPTTIGTNDVKLKISMTNSSPNSSSTVDGIPSINDNSANATVIISNGETAVMAGLIKQNDSSSRNGVPGLSSIPFLGWLFKTQLEKSDTTEVMIMITPTIINDTLPNVKTAQAQTTAEKK